MINRNFLFALGLFCLISGCASQRAPMAEDPLEGLNRTMFTVHEGLDTVLLKPMAQGYDALLPNPAQRMVGNFFDNFRDVVRGGNAILQGEGERGVTRIGRFLINSTLGIVGLFDVASAFGLEKGNESFGQTLAVWGVPPGPYLFLPLIGPSGGRDIVGFGVDTYANPLWHLTKDDPAVRNSLYVTNAVHFRASLLPTDHILEEATWDKYAYIRGAYMQRKRAELHEGKPTPLWDDDEPNGFEQAGGK